MSKKANFQSRANVFTAFIQNVSHCAVAALQYALYTALYPIYRGYALTSLSHQDTPPQLD